MMTIGISFVFIIFVMGTILAVDEEISEEKRQQFFKDVLDAHNYYRKKHGADKLKLDKKLCDTTMKYAETLKTNPSEKFPTGYGLTCYGISFSGPPRLNEIPELNGKIAVREMYIFGAGYNYAIEPPSPEKTNVFTQILWKETKNIGVGFVINNGNLVLFISYSPAGNIKGQYVNNVSARNNKTKPKKNNLAQEVDQKKNIE